MRIPPISSLIVLFVIVIPKLANAQLETGADSVQKKILDLYDEGKFSEVVSYGEKALKNGYDTYAVRNSLGKVYYKRKNYFKAIPNFEKAARLSYNDPENSFYLYNSYDFTDRIEDRNYIYYELPKALKKKLKPLENSFADDVYFEIGSEFTNDFDANSSVKLGGNDNFYGEQVLNGDVFHLKAGIHQVPLKWIRIAYEYSYRNHKNKKEIQYKDQKVTDDYSRTENRFYNKFDFRVKKGLIVSPAAHYIGMEDNTIYANTDSIFTYDTLSSATIYKKDFFEDNFIISVEGKKYYRNMLGGINGSFSYLNHDHQTQIGAFFKYYLRPDAGLYAGANATMHFQDATRIIFEPYAGGRVDDKLSGNIFLTLGTMINFNNENAYSVFNNGDKIKFRIGARAEYEIKFNLHAYISYQYQYREREYTTSEISQQSIQTPVDYQMKTSALKYDVNDFSAGVKFGF